MDNEIIPQPLDTLMTKLGIKNADLVKASTDQLSFKMVQKGRSGRRLTIHGQEKILKAIVALKPDLKVKRRELFRYEPSESVVAEISNALALSREKKLKYPQFIDLLAQAGINHYVVDVAANRITFYGLGGQVHVEQGLSVSQNAPGSYDEDKLSAVIEESQEEIIDHTAFLRKILEAGIVEYEVNIRKRQIRYKGESQFYKGTIPLSNPAHQAAAVQAAEKKTEKPVKTGKAKKAVKIVKSRKLWKAVKLHRVKKRQFKRHR